MTHVVKAVRWGALVVWLNGAVATIFGIATSHLPAIQIGNVVLVASLVVVLATGGWLRGHSEAESGDG
jgi:hypothetical protein